MLIFLQKNKSMYNFFSLPQILCSFSINTSSKLRENGNYDRLFYFSLTRLLHLTFMLVEKHLAPYDGSSEMILRQCSFAWSAVSCFCPGAVKFEFSFKKWERIFRSSFRFIESTYDEGTKRSNPQSFLEFVKTYDKQSKESAKRGENNTLVVLSSRP